MERTEGHRGEERVGSGEDGFDSDGVVMEWMYFDTCRENKLRRRF